MTKPLFKDLVEQQIAVLRATSLLVIVFMPCFLAGLYFGFGIKETLPVIIISFVAVVLVNLLLLQLHKMPPITYIVLISSTFIELIALTLTTGGLLSPFVFIVVILPVFAFYTSRKQGRIWFVICFIAVIVIYNLERFGLHATNVIPEKDHNPILFVVVLFVTVLTSLYLNLVKQDISRAHKLMNHGTKDLEEKTKRMENLIMLVNYSTELMCVIDSKGLTFDEVNPLFKITLGYELSELRGKPITTVLKENALPKLTAIAEDGVAYFSSMVKCRNGEEKMFNWSATAKNGKLYAYANAQGNK
jgi:PAS domain S-box-containing protein